MNKEKKNSKDICKIDNNFGCNKISPKYIIIFDEVDYEKIKTIHKLWNLSFTKS